MMRLWDELQAQSIRMGSIKGKHGKLSKSILEFLQFVIVCVCVCSVVMTSLVAENDVIVLRRRCST